MSSASSPPKPAGGVDTQENRTYIQKTRLWTLGEVLSSVLMQEKPEDPISKICDTLKNELETRTEHVDAPSSELVADSKEYMQKMRIAFLFEDWLKACLESRPEKGVEFSLEFFKKIRDGKSSKAAAASSSGSQGNIMIVFDAAAPNTAFAAKAASVGVIELGFSAHVKSVSDLQVQELVNATAVIIVVGESNANDSAITAKIGPATSQLAGAVVVAGNDVSVERVDLLTDMFARHVPTEKAAAAGSSTGAARVAGNGKALLIVQQDEGAASAANLLGRNIVDFVSN